MRKTLLLVFACGCVLVLADCLIVYFNVVQHAERWAEDTVYLFHDRQQALLEHLYVVRGREVVVQVAVFPGYTDRKWYYCRRLPEALFLEVKNWAVWPGDLSPPFVPGGPCFSRISFRSDKARGPGEAWFRDDNQAVREWLQTLRQRLVRDQYRVDNLPPWVVADERVKGHFGL